MFNVASAITQGLAFAISWAYARLLNEEEKMAIKLVALDLDDTLLDPNLIISAASIRSIQKVRQRGIKITISTGRMFLSALPYALQMGLDIPFITYQGAWVRNSLSKQELYYRPVPFELAHEVMGILKGLGVHYHSYFNDCLVMEALSEEGKAYSRLAGVQPTVVKDIMKGLENNDAMKIMAISPDAREVLEIEQYLKSIHGDKLHITRSKPHYLEIMHPEADKAKALEVLARHYKIDRQEVMAIGDSYNDMEMITWAGVGVAMGNSVKALKDMADFVTASNMEEGVAAALHHLILC